MNKGFNWLINWLFQHLFEGFVFGFTLWFYETYLNESKQSSPHETSICLACLIYKKSHLWLIFFFFLLSLLYLHHLYILYYLEAESIAFNLNYYNFREFKMLSYLLYSPCFIWFVILELFFDFESKLLYLFWRFQRRTYILHGNYQWPKSLTYA